MFYWGILLGFIIGGSLGAITMGIVAGARNEQNYIELTETNEEKNNEVEE